MAPFQRHILHSLALFLEYYLWTFSLKLKVFPKSDYTKAFDNMLKHQYTWKANFKANDHLHVNWRGLNIFLGSLPI